MHIMTRYCKLRCVCKVINPLPDTFQFAAIKKLVNYMFPVSPAVGDLNICV